MTSKKKILPRRSDFESVGYGKAMELALMRKAFFGWMPKPSVHVDRRRFTTSSDLEALRRLDGLESPAKRARVLLNIWAGRSLRVLHAVIILIIVGLGHSYMKSVSHYHRSSTVVVDYSNPERSLGPAWANQYAKRN